MRRLGRGSDRIKKWWMGMKDLNAFLNRLSIIYAVGAIRVKWSRTKSFIHRSDSSPSLIYDQPHRHCLPAWYPVFLISCNLSQGNETGKPKLSPAGECLPIPKPFRSSLFRGGTSLHSPWRNQVCGYVDDNRPIRMFVCWNLLLSESFGRPWGSHII